MSRFSLLFSGLAIVSLALWATGCSSETVTTPAPTNTQGGDDHAGHDHDGEGHEGHDHDGDDHAGHDHGDADPGEIAEAMAQLSEEDRAAAEAQKVCVVSDEPLGVMGKPIKVTVKDQTVFLCCDGCQDKLMADPDKYLAKLQPQGDGSADAPQEDAPQPES